MEGFMKKLLKTK